MEDKSQGVSELWVATDGRSFHEAPRCEGAGKDAMKRERGMS